MGSSKPSVAKSDYLLSLYFTFHLLFTYLKLRKRKKITSGFNYVYVTLFTNSVHSTWVPPALV